MSTLTEADKKLLNKLFADERGAFRHRLSLSRSDTCAFYAPTTEARAIHARKEAILSSTSAGKYLLETTEGLPVFEEFVDVAGCDAAVDAAAPDERTRNRAATLALEPDWMLLLPPTHLLAWASVCFPTRWSLVGKRLKPLTDIHSIVPGLNGELGRKIDTFFGRLVPGDGWGRANWGLSSSPVHDQHPDNPYTPLSDQTPLETVYLRIESQHLLKMPSTGAIAFGIRIVNFPLIELEKEHLLLAGLREQLRTMPEEVARYKGIPGKFWERL